MVARSLHVADLAAGKDPTGKRFKLSTWTSITEFHYIFSVFFTGRTHTVMFMSWAILAQPLENKIE